MPTRTTTKLINDLRDPANAAAWTAFERRYRPILEGFARKLDFSPDDAEEIAQQAIAEFVTAYRAGRYERDRGRLSSWLIGIARHIASDLRRRRRAEHRAGGDSLIAELPRGVNEDQHLSQIWSRERDAAILAEAMAVLRQSVRMEEHTLRAFELFVIRGTPAEAVAEQCGIDVDSVYVIKNRLIKRLREIVQELTSAYDEGS